MSMANFILPNGFHYAVCRPRLGHRVSHSPCLNWFSTFTWDKLIPVDLRDNWHGQGGPLALHRCMMQRSCSRASWIIGPYSSGKHCQIWPATHLGMLNDGKGGRLSTIMLFLLLHPTARTDARVKKIDGPHPIMDHAYRIRAHWWNPIHWGYKSPTIRSRGVPNCAWQGWKH